MSLQLQDTTYSALFLLFYSTYANDISTEETSVTGNTILSFVSEHLSREQIMTWQFFHYNLHTHIISI